MSNDYILQQVPSKLRIADLTMDFYDLQNLLFTCI